MLPKLTEVTWWLVDDPYNFYCVISVLDNKYMHKVQVIRKYLEIPGLTVPEAFAKIMRVDLECEPRQRRTRTFT